MKITRIFSAAALLCLIAGCTNLCSDATKTQKVSTAGDGDFVIGPDYTNAPELTVRDGVPQGTVHHFVMDSADSKIYLGLKGPYQRDVWVYVPSQYRTGKAAPFMVVQDGKSYTNRLPVALDNMIYDHRLPVMIAVMERAASAGWSTIRCRSNTRNLLRPKCCRASRKSIT